MQRARRARAPNADDRRRRGPDERGHKHKTD
jgi:hypothetical protein